MAELSNMMSPEEELDPERFRDGERTGGPRVLEVQGIVMATKLLYDGAQLIEIRKEDGGLYSFRFELDGRCAREDIDPTAFVPRLGQNRFVGYARILADLRNLLNCLDRSEATELKLPSSNYSLSTFISFVESALLYGMRDGEFCYKLRCVIANTGARILFLETEVCQRRTIPLAEVWLSPPSLAAGGDGSESNADGS